MVNFFFLSVLFCFDLNRLWYILIGCFIHEWFTRYTKLTDTVILRTENLFVWPFDLQKLYFILNLFHFCWVQPGDVLMAVRFNNVSSQEFLGKLA